MHRAKILQGQMRGLEKMIADEAYCMDILVQTLAIQRSLRSLNKLLLENHLKTHVQDKLASRKSVAKNKAVAELLDLYEVSNVRGR